MATKLVVLGVTPVRVRDDDCLEVHALEMDIDLSALRDALSGVGAGAKTLGDIVVALGSPAQEHVPATYSAPAGVDVTTSTTVVLAANGDREVAVVVNDSDEVIYLAIGNDAALNKGIRLNPNGGSVQFGGPGGLPLTVAAINGIHGGTGNKAVTVQEAT